jgi:coenzyme F420 hydrogenase subunit beta
MDSHTSTSGQALIEESVIRQRLCTGCTACVNLCPYFQHHRDHIIVTHSCDGEDGRCETYCPRTPVSLARLQAALYDPDDITPELGPVKGLYITRADDPATGSVPNTAERSVP